MDIISLDAGFGNLKVWNGAGGTVLGSHAALVGGGHRYEDVYESDDDGVQLIEFDGSQIYAGLGAHRYGRSLGDLSFERITSGSDEMRALFYAALAQHFGTTRKARGEYHLYVQLPVGLMQAESASCTKAQLAEWVVGEHEWMSWDQKFKLTITGITVQSQAGAAVYDHLFDLKGQPIDAHVADLDGEIGIVSIGYKTVELMILEFGQPVHDMTTSTLAGVSELLRAADGGRRGLHRADVMLRNGHLDEEIKVALPGWAKLVRARISENWPSQISNFKAVILVGGGSILLKDHLRDMFSCKVITPDEPILSIARGGYKKGVRDAASRETQKAG